MTTELLDRIRRVLDEGSPDRKRVLQNGEVMRTSMMTIDTAKPSNAAGRMMLFDAPVITDARAAAWEGMVHDLENRWRKSAADESPPLATSHAKPCATVIDRESAHAAMVARMTCAWRATA